LRADDEEKSARDRNLEKALQKIDRIRKPGSRGGPPKDGDDKWPKGAEVVIDFERLHERVHRVALPDGNATTLFWSPDSKKLAFTGSYQGRPGTYTIDVPVDPTPKQLSSGTGSQPRWLKQGNQIVWLAAGIPTSLPATGGAAAAPSGGGASPGGRTLPP